jgi:5-methyltetrahydrofolate--homocysteine methyltransferase
MIGVMGGDVLMGHDAHCAAWIRKFREPSAEGEGAGAGGRRGRENRRRGGGGGGAANGGTEGVQAAASQTAEVVNG